MDNYFPEGYIADAKVLLKLPGAHYHGHDPAVPIQVLKQYLKSLELDHRNKFMACLSVLTLYDQLLYEQLPECSKQLKSSVLIPRVELGLSGLHAKPADLDKFILGKRQHFRCAIDEVGIFMREDALIDDFRRADLSIKSDPDIYDYVNKHDIEI